MKIKLIKIAIFTLSAITFTSCATTTSRSYGRDSKGAMVEIVVTRSEAVMPTIPVGFYLNVNGPQRIPQYGGGGYCPPPMYNGGCNLPPHRQMQPPGYGQRRPMYPPQYPPQQRYCPPPRPMCPPGYGGGNYGGNYGGYGGNGRPIGHGYAPGYNGYPRGRNPNSSALPDFNSAANGWFD